MKHVKKEKMKSIVITKKMATLFAACMMIMPVMAIKGDIPVIFISDATQVTEIVQMESWMKADCYLTTETLVLETWMTETGYFNEKPMEVEGWMTDLTYLKK